VFIDGKSSKKGTIRIKPGDHTFRVEHEGFQTIESLKSIKEGSGGDTVEFMLTPVSDEARDWATSNQQRYLDAEGIAGEQAQATGEQFAEKNPIVRFLPYYGLYYRIDYATPDTTKSDKVVVEIRGGNPRG